MIDEEAQNLIPIYLGVKAKVDSDCEFTFVQVK